MAPPFLNQFLSQEPASKSSFVRRRKHQKSRRGCTTCKRRHIRCDEADPQCQNCIVHRSTCSYPEAHYWAISACKPSIPEDTKFDPPSSAGYNAKESATNANDDETTPPATESSGAKSRTAEPSFRSLDPYFSSMVPMTVEKRELLAFCESNRSSYYLMLSALRTVYTFLIISALVVLLYVNEGCSRVPFYGFLLVISLLLLVLTSLQISKK